MRIILITSALLGCATSAQAQPVSSTDEVVQIAAPASAMSAALPEICCNIPALTPISIKLDSAMNSKANMIGEKFSFVLAEPIKMDGVELVPAGTPGSGDVVHAAKSRFGGKAGELLLAVRYLDHKGVRIPLRSLKFEQERGKDNSGNAFAAGAIVSPLLIFVISGGEVNIPAGTIAFAKTAADVTITQSVAASAVQAESVQQLPQEGEK